MIQEAYRGARQWSRNRQAVAIVAWVSFLTAAVATMLTFAFFDPIDLAHLLQETLAVGREAGYAVGFFCYWILFAVCSGLTAWLVRTAPKRDAANR